MSHALPPITLPGQLHNFFATGGTQPHAEHVVFAIHVHDDHQKQGAVGDLGVADLITIASINSAA